MGTRYEKDRFDVVPHDVKRVGAHRAPRKAGHGWIPFGWAVLATLILVGISALWILGIDNNLNLGSVFGENTPSATATHTTTPTTTTTPTPTVAPTVDPKLSVTVLNGTTTAHLAQQVSDKLKKAGWKVSGVANASQSDLADTVVYYADPTLEGAAKGLAKSLPGATLRITQDFADSGADLTVVVGANYAG